ncbi:hypothetical protein CKM354_000136100 [Cercospora kikuchii]|uniref:Uncharacterized protein n=1 Tax=Cercospora kikuchii TaxID=84275 RepID=A0A9P3CFW1_9PEZI|nr:uncharacterized protein CKM354_000136100 [Cercospora kikuchii]GIZ37933.1 hypothetical protein CKM354_000136100 [Cercospora kikuchii]
MKFSAVAAAIPALAGVTNAFYSKQDYISGKVHSDIMEEKMRQWHEHEVAGDYQSAKWSGFDKWSSSKGKPVKCRNGLAVAKEGDPLQTFRCKDTDLYDFKSHAELGGNNSSGSGSWGWTFGRREFAAIGQSDGVAFAEVTRDGKLEYLGRLPQQHTALPSQWRELKTNGNYLVVGSEAVNHGVQFFDMRKLLTLSPRNPKTFDTRTDLTGWFNELPAGRSHNVVVNEELNYVVAVGAQPRNDSCAAGLIFIDVKDPKNPKKTGCAPQDGYIHDAQCIVYRGPDKKYNGKDVCYGYNLNTLTIYLVENKNGGNASTVISRTPYKGASYTHQGWVIDPNWQTHLIMDDELDEGLRPDRASPESPALDGFPVTYIFNIENLEKPVNTGFYKSGVRSIDHNQYIYDGLAYQSNYGAGLRILDISSIPEKEDGSEIEEVAFFDIYPEDDNEPGGGNATFVGTWNHYTYPSGYVVVNTIERGAFVVKLSKFRGRGKGKRYVRRGQL